ncbi:MAG TPA: hypothetical protein VIM79_14675 [Niastella sp.]
MTKKRKVFFLIPFVIVIALLLNTWFILLTNEFAEIYLTQYLGFILFVPVLYLLYKDRSFKKALLALGLYLLLATFCVANIFPYNIWSKMSITFSGLKIPLPSMNGLSLLLFILYFALNLGTLIEIQLDYKESKGKS